MEVKPPRPAATVMLIRDGNDGPEVFMVKRNMSASFAGMYVFPGGVVDPDDGGPEHEGLGDGLTDADASDQLGVASGGLAFWVAAVRECFEEAGVLLASGVDFSDADVAARFTGHQHAVHGRESRFVDICEAERLRLMLTSIEYIAHWITPVSESRRFDTRFFVTRAPDHQVALHDEKETVASEWIRAADALRRGAAGELTIIPPTMACLNFLAPHTSVDSAMEAAKAISRPAPIQPVVVMNDGLVTGLLHPGNPGYEEARAAEVARAIAGDVIG